MLNIINDFTNILHKNALNTRNICLFDAIKDYFFFEILNEIDQEKKNKILINLMKSKAMVIDLYKYISIDKLPQYLIISFKKTLIFLHQESLDFLKYLCSQNPNLSIFILHNAKYYLNKKKIFLQNESKYNDTFIDEISSFKPHFPCVKSKNASLQEFISNIQPCISGYLIQESYLKLNKNRIENFKLNQSSLTRIIDENELIRMRILGISTTSMINLVYDIKNEEIYAMKEFKPLDPEYQKLVKRELDNYTKLSYPFFPKFIGTNKSKNIIIFEFINGISLNNTKNLHLSLNDKLSIIFDLLLTFDYLHRKNLIYRDLKPNNVMIDENKSIVLIDFDRMILINENETEYTKEFTEFAAPELNSDNVSIKCDIYSIGKMMIHILKDENIDDFNQYFIIKDMIQKCINIDKPDNRPNASQLLLEFYINFKYRLNNINFFETDEYYKTYFQNALVIMNKIGHTLCNLGVIYCKGEIIEPDFSKAIHYLTLAANQNNLDALYNLGNIYFKGKYIEQDINKSIHYYTLAANQNHLEALYNLGNIYYRGKYVKQNINKAIYYYSLAANQNDASSLYNLGVIFYNEKYIKMDIKKAIHYFTLAAKQNHLDALYNLGNIYFKGKYVKQDINKSIYYYTLAANQNHRDSIYQLGSIYIRGDYVKRDIDKGIHYLTIAASKNDSIAQFDLGCIFSEGAICKIDIEKAIYYFTLAANQNHQDSQFNIGNIYYRGEYVKRDINKAIYYFTLAANQNDSVAQYCLGSIYLNGEYIKRDINKAIHYLTLAANQNNSKALCRLGNAFLKGEFGQHNIEKAIHYFILSSNQNNSNAQFILGSLYYNSNLVPRDIDKAIHFLSLAANQQNVIALYLLGIIYSDHTFMRYDINKAIHYLSLASQKNDTKSQLNLGLIYFYNECIPRDINKAFYYFSLAAHENNPYIQFFLGYIYLSVNIKKAIYYFTRAANLNNADAQYYLGRYCFIGFHIEKNINKGIDLIMQSSKNGYIKAHFSLGFLYHEGNEYLKRNIKESMQLYKNASSFNNQFAKNNIGIIYKNGFENEIVKNLGAAEIYFKEAINQKNDCVSMYNLSHIYIYEYGTSQCIDKSIELLVNSGEQGFNPSIFLLCLVIVKKHGTNIEIIKEELMKYCIDINKILSKIQQIITDQELQFDQNVIKLYESQKEIDFLYDLFENYFPSKNLGLKEDRLNKKIINKKHDITKDFYDGFGF